MCDKLPEIPNGRNAWASELKNHVYGCIELIAAEAIYHIDCASFFFFREHLLYGKGSG